MSLDVRRISLVALAALLIAIPLVSRAQDPADSRRLTRAAAVERRLALVIGNNAYASAPLRNAIADAQAVSAALREAGFEVTLLTDVPLAAMERAVDAFAGRLEPGDMAIFYFSGHGVAVESENYLIPVDFSGVDEVDIKYRSYPALRARADHSRRGDRAPVRHDVQRGILSGAIAKRTVATHVC